MAMINYADKVALNSNSNIADINKVNATDMNEIKNAFNNQVAQGWYKTGLSPTFTYSSWDSTTKTGVVNSNLDLTPYLSAGMKVKFTQSSTIKYGIITKISSSQITLYMGTDYTLNNSGISNAFYSMLKAPYGFPMDEDKWTLSTISTVPLSQANPAKNTYYNIGNLKLLVPIGSWKLSWSGNAYPQRTPAGTCEQQCGLSTVNNSTNMPVLNATVYGEALLKFLALVNRETNVLLTSDTTYYLMARTTQTNMTSIGFYGTNIYGSTVIKAVCAYL